MDIALGCVDEYEDRLVLLEQKERAEKLQKEIAKASEKTANTGNPVFTCKLAVDEFHINEQSEGTKCCPGKECGELIKVGSHS